MGRLLQWDYDAWEDYLYWQNYDRNAFYFHNTLYKVQNHPRIRGEHPKSISFFLTKAGITPAYAGNTTSTDFNELTVPDHPRIRGEYYITAITKLKTLSTQSFLAFCKLLSPHLDSFDLHNTFHPDFPPE